MPDLIEPLVVDDFFDHPDEVRNYALNAIDYYPASIHMTKGNWPGYRSYFLPWVNNRIFDEFCSKLFKLLDIPEDTPAFFDVSFNYCTASSPKGVVHKDKAWSIPDHVGLVYLTPNPPENSGTILYSPTEELLQSGQGPDYHDPNNHTVKLKLDNVYNRFVMYDPMEYHNADQYFGETLEDSRLFMVFFLRIENMSYTGLHKPKIYSAAPSRKISLPWFDNPQRKDTCTCGSGRKFKACCGSLSTDRNPPQGMAILHQAIDADQCEMLYISSQIDTNGEEVADMQLPGVLGNVDNVDEKSEIGKTLLKLIKEHIEPWTRHRFEYLEQPRVFQFAIDGQRFLHSDSEEYNPKTQFAERVWNRDLSILLFTEAIAPDAEMEFPFFNYRLKPQRGDLLVFPSDQRFRYSISRSAMASCTVIASWAVFKGTTPLEKLPDNALRMPE